MLRLPGPPRAFVVGIGGGSGAGKTTLARALLDRLGPERAVLVQHDSYYRDRRDLAPAARGQLNFDEPAAYDNDLLLEHLGSLVRGEPIDKPVYDFASHTRAPWTERVAPRDVLILEGILLLADARLRRPIDIKVYVEAEPDVRFIRRLARDTAERGRSVDSVIRQYLANVRPMHARYVEPSKEFADLVIPGDGPNGVAIELVAARISEAVLREPAPWS